MSAKLRVRPPSSSREANTGLTRCRSPAATWRMPSASSSSGRASWLPSTTASSTAPNTDSTSDSVSVPMYMLAQAVAGQHARWLYSR